MKFLVITAVQAYERDIQDILNKASVKSYSFTEVTGSHNVSIEDMESNWFAGSRHTITSTLFYVFAEEATTEKVFEAVNSFNRKKETTSNIHIAIMSIEKSNEI